MNDEDTQISFNPRYAIAYDYDEERNCAEAGCDTICRCSKIVDFAIESTKRVDESDVRIRILNPKTKTRRWINRKQSDIEDYCIRRILILAGAYDANLYEADISRGYYGEEIVGIDFENESEVINNVKTLLSKSTDLEKVLYVLNLEYGYITVPIQKAKSVSVVTHDLEPLVEKEKMIKRGIGYIGPLDPEEPNGVVLSDNGHIRLIDGHHRRDALLAEGCTESKFLMLNTEE